jgi:hypothetical protein
MTKRLNITLPDDVLDELRGFDAILLGLAGTLGVERVDVITLRDASALLGGRIVTRGRRVFDRDPHRATEAEIRALTAYWDFAPVLEMKHRALAERMGEYDDV